jgi:hypothetical protein
MKMRAYALKIRSFWMIIPKYQLTSTSLVRPGPVRSGFIKRAPDTLISNGLFQLPEVEDSLDSIKGTVDMMTSGDLIERLHDEYGLYVGTNSNKI